MSCCRWVGRRWPLELVGVVVRRERKGLGWSVRRSLELDRRSRTEVDQLDYIEVGVEVLVVERLGE